MTTYEEWRMASLEPFQVNMETLYKQEVLVVGSIGRSAIHQALSGDAAREFTARGERWPLWQYTSLPRDIDTLDPGENPYAMVRYRREHFVDSTAFNNMHVRFERHGARWRVTTNPGGKQERALDVDAALLAPWEGRAIYDTRCLTVRPAMHRILLSSRSPRDKDRIALRLLDEVMPEEDKELLLSEPYVALASLMSRV